MSLFPSEHLSVAITPTAVAMVCYRGRWRPVQHDAHEVRFDDGGIDNVLAGLAHAFSAWSRPAATVRYSVSNAFVRAALFPWPGDRLSAEEEAVLAHQYFVELYGDMDGWQIQVNRARRFRQPSLAFAMPSRLVDELLLLSRHHRLDCRGITPAAVQSWNASGQVSTKSHLLFSTIESGYGFLLATQRAEKFHVPVAARVLPLSGEASEIKAALQREILLQGLDEATHTSCETFGQPIQIETDVISVLPVRVNTSVAMAMATKRGMF